MGALTHMPLKIYNPVPDGQYYPGVHLHLYLDPECSYVLSAQFSLKQALGQAVRQYISMIPAYSAAQLLVALSVQLSSIRTTGLCLPVTSALNQAKMVLILVVVPTIFQGSIWPLFSMILPQPDDIGAVGIGNVVLRAALYMVSYGLNIAAGFVFTAGAIVCGHLWMRFLMFWRPNQKKLVLEQQVTIVWKRSTISVVCVLVGIALTTSSAFGLVLGCLVACLKLAARCGYQRALEDRKGKRGSTTGWQLHLTLVMLWVLGALLAVPSMLVWGHNVPYALHLPNDPYLPCSAIVLLSVAVTWQDVVPIVHRLHYETASTFIYCLSFLCVLYCPVTLYSINYFIALSFVALAAQQVLGSDGALKQA